MRAEPPRLNVQISEEQSDRLRRLLPWGVQGELFRKIVTDTCDFIEEYGKIGIAAYMTNRISLLDMLKKKETKDATKRPKAKSSRAAKTGGNQPDSSHPSKQTYTEESGEGKEETSREEGTSNQS